MCYHFGRVNCVKNSSALINTNGWSYSTFISSASMTNTVHHNVQSMCNNNNNRILAVASSRIKILIFRKMARAFISAEIRSTVQYFAIKTTGYCHNPSRSVIAHFGKFTVFEVDKLNIVLKLRKSSTEIKNQFNIDRSKKN